MALRGAAAKAPKSLASVCGLTSAQAEGTRKLTFSAMDQNSWLHASSCGCGMCGGKPISYRDLSSAASGATNRGVIFMGPK